MSSCQQASMTLEEKSEVSTILPQEIIFEILLRLPVKSVLKFKCVSKSWLSLLSNSLFSKTHVKFSLNNPKLIGGYRLAVVATISRLDKICNIYNMGSENSSLTVSKQNCPPKSLPLSWILGSCNGLICLTNDSFTLMLLNPCTEKFNVFPDSMLRNKGGGGDSGCYVRYGFGYDAPFDDYKVVKIFSFKQLEGRYENMVQVYSLKAKSWKTIEGFNSGYMNAKLGIFANGALHWEACLGDSWEIVTLDLAAERYGEMALPSYENGGIYWTLSVSRGYLVGCCNYELNKADVWVMKEYGVENSWTKLVTVSSPVDRRRAYISLLFAAENCDEFLLQIGKELTMYNSRDGSFKQLDGYTSGEFRQVHAAATYFDSLASPHLVM